MLFFCSLNASHAQSDERYLYQKAYDHLNDSIVKSNRVSAEKLAKNCEACCVKGVELSFLPDLQIADRFIRNDRGFPLKDLTDRHYGLSKSCNTALRMGTRQCEKANAITDSLALFWQHYEAKPDHHIRASLNGLISQQKDGYQVFFSDVYQNTLMAEVMEFCSSYDSGIWFGASTSVFFVFDIKGDIKAVYSGISIRYN